MCGFAGMFGESAEGGDGYRVRKMLSKLSHRGPDDEDFYRDDRACLAQNGLAVVDLEARRRPLGSEDETLWIVGDVEAYGVSSMRQRLHDDHRFDTNTGLETIIHLFEEYGADCVEHVEGAFAFVLYDARRRRLFMARDSLGVKPLYYGYRGDTLYFASEIKALAAATMDIREFPPGHYFESDRGFRRYFRLPKADALQDSRQIDDPDEAVTKLRARLEQAVHKRMETDASLGAFLSGGLDSSLITAIAVRQRPGLKTFAVGMEGSSDLAAARVVADGLGTDHYEYVITEDDIRDALPHVIYYLESFDPALVRGAMANYFAARLAGEHVKVVLSGEGADELFSGYTYLRELDVEGELPRELRLITGSLHNTGLQRLDRMTAAHSIAGRAPFLDGSLVDLAFRISPRLKMYGKRKVEKWILRKAAEDYLPHSIIWRGKEKFAIGTGISDVLKRLAEENVSMAEYGRERRLDNGFEIKSREEYYYYKVFRRFFPAEQVTSVMGRSRSLDAMERYA